MIFLTSLQCSKRASSTEGSRAQRRALRSRGRADTLCTGPGNPAGPWFAPGLLQPQPLLAGKLLQQMSQTPGTSELCYMQRWGRSDSHGCVFCPAEQSLYADSWAGSYRRWWWLKTPGDLMPLKTFSGYMESIKQHHRQHNLLILRP